VAWGSPREVDDEQSEGWSGETNNMSDGKRVSNQRILVQRLSG
jgi:hypothetical protein